MRPTLTFISAMLWGAIGVITSLAARADNTLPEIAQLAALRAEAVAYENGEGVPRNPTLAATLYCEGARRGDAQAHYNLGWMYANGRGIERNDATAAYFFRAAAELGLEAATRMLKVVGNPTPEMPECLRKPAPLPTDTPSQASAKPGKHFERVAPRKVWDLVMKIAPQYKVEPQLALAIISAESNFDSLAQSPKNAQGLMQLIPETSERFNVKNAFDPAQNIRGGVAYLRWLLAYFEGDVALVAAAYNAGEGRVEQYRGVPPFQETRAYVQRILGTVGQLVHPFDASITRPSPSLSLIRLALLRR